jgi:hypothetical protein
MVLSKKVHFLINPPNYFSASRKFTFSLWWNSFHFFTTEHRLLARWILTDQGSFGFIIKSVITSFAGIYNKSIRNISELSSIFFFCTVDKLVRNNLLKPMSVLRNANSVFMVLMASFLFLILLAYLILLVLLFFFKE